MDEADSFQKMVVMMGAVNEVDSLRTTVDRIEKSCSPEDIARMIIFLAPNATEACRNEAERLATAQGRGGPIPIVAAQEGNGGLGREVQKTLRKQTDATHCLIWTADQDAPSETVLRMLAQTKKNPQAMVALSRFLPGGSLPAERGIRANARSVLFRWFFQLFFWRKLTDPHFMIALFPIHDFVRFDLREKSKSFVMEYKTFFVRLGAPIIELPQRQAVRQEGASNVSLKNKLRFLVPVIRLRFTPKSKLLKKDEHE
jgi:hypothetical protein